MTEEEAIEILQNRIKLPEDNTYGEMCERKYQQEAIDLAITALCERIERDNGWIPVEDRLPDNDDHEIYPVAHDCLCRDMHGNCGVAMYYSPVTSRENPWITSDEDLDTDLITHWQPLPPPPRKDEEK